MGDKDSRTRRILGAALASAALAALALGNAAGLAAQDRAGGFRGSVQSAELRPLTSATLTLPDLGRLAITNESGEFYLRDLPPGNHRVEVEYLGLKYETRIGVRPGEVSLKHYRLDVTLTQLEPLRVEVRAAASMKLREFLRREMRAAGFFLGRDDIDRLRPLSLSDMLADVSGVRSGNADARRRDYSIGRGPGNCPPNLFIDGSPVVSFGPDDFFPQHIEAIEVYESFSRTPIRYRSHNRCGAILIWTRETFR